MALEVPESNTTEEIIKLLQDYSSLFPKSSNFSFTVDNSNNFQNIHSVQGMFQECIRVGNPRITIHVRGPFNVYWKRFSENGLRMISERRTIKGDARTLIHEAEYMVGLHVVFLEDFKRVFEWQKYSQEFDELLEEELSKKPE